MKPEHIQHLFWRIGFGATPQNIKSLSKKSKKAIINQIFEDSKNVQVLKIDTSEIDVLLNGDKATAAENKRKLQQLSRKKTIDLNIAWIDRLKESKSTLREKMTLFWANIFVCEDNNVVYIQQFNNTLRTHALGHLGEFIKAIAKEAAMTKYLNTKQNRKQSPNENFARELMELFTLGEGRYSEDDIKESARAFTGYSHNLKGEFVFKKAVHDTGNKTFFGKIGNFKGDDIIDIILEQKQCAQFICEKVYRYFVNDHINANHVNDMTEVFFGDYDIEKLMRFVFTSEWFYSKENMGTKIKSPIEFLVGMNTTVPFNFDNKKQLLFLQRQLGQILLNPPNVAGWKGGKNWIDSNTIVLRLKLPSLLLNNAYISKVGVENSGFIGMDKDDFKKQFGRAMKTTSSWGDFEKNFQGIEMDELPNYILSCAVHPNTAKYLRSLSKVSKQEYCVQLMSLPEYQMC